MRILHVTEAADYGVLKHISLVTVELARLGHECSVLLFGGRICDDASFSCPCAVHRQRGGRLFNLPDSICAIRRAVREFMPDVIHLHAFAAGVAGRLAYPGCIYSPHSFSVHGSVPFLLRTAAAAAEKMLVRRTAAYALVSGNERDCAVKTGLPDEKLHVCPNGLPEDFQGSLLSRSAARRELSAIIPDVFSGDVPVGVFPGRLVSQKNPGLVLDAMERARAESIRIVFCGDGPLLGPLRKRNVPGAHFAGRVAGLSRLLRGFDFAVMPSRYEGMSYSFLECLGAGLPVAATENCVDPEVFSGHYHAVSGLDAGELAAAICSCASAGYMEPYIPYSVASQAECFLKIYVKCAMSREN